MGCSPRSCSAPLRQTEGPFYPDKLPLDTDNDLILVNDDITPAVGEITHLTGRVLDATGSPIRNATVEIWQCDANAVYLHTGDSGTNRRPARTRTSRASAGSPPASTGEYYFRTIKPVPYPGRPQPHIHFKVKPGGRKLLTTQIIIAGHPGNELDGIFLGAGDVIDRELIQADFKPIPGSKIGEFAAQFDIVLGRTPDEEVLQRGRTANR